MGGGPSIYLITIFFPLRLAGRASITTLPTKRAFRVPPQVEHPRRKEPMRDLPKDRRPDVNTVVVYSSALDDVNTVVESAGVSPLAGSGFPLHRFQLAPRGGWRVRLRQSTLPFRDAGGHEPRLRTEKLSSWPPVL